MAFQKLNRQPFISMSRNNYDRTEITVKKGSKSLIEAAAKADNEKVINGYVKKVVKAKYEADTGEKIEL